MDFLSYLKNSPTYDANTAQQLRLEQRGPNPANAPPAYAGTAADDEEELRRRQQANAQQAATAARPDGTDQRDKAHGTAPAASGSPVSSTGKIQPQSATPAATSPIAAAVAPQAASADPFAAMGGGVQIAGGGWVPKNHPLAAQAAQPQTPPASGGTAQTPNPYVGYTAPPDVGGDSVYTARDITVSQGSPYVAGEIGQFTAPDQTALGGGIEALLANILRNPRTMTPDAVAAMKEQAKEGTLSEQNALRQAIQDGIAARGLGTNSQLAAAQQRRLADAATSQYLDQAREVDLAKLKQDRADELDATEAANAYLTSQMSRATQGYNSQLAGQLGREQTRQQQGLQDITRGMNTAQVAQWNEANRRAGADSALARDAMGLDAWKANQGLLSDNSNAAANRELERARLALQERLGVGGLDLDRAKLTESGRQFDAGHGLNVLQFLEGRRQYDTTGNRLDQQFTDQMGLGWANLNANSISNLLRVIYGG